MIPEAFWAGLEYLIGTSTLTIDRPKGSEHPNFPQFIYPLDYGYLEGTTAGDGDGIDVWIGGAKGTGLVGVLCTVDRWKRDAELKLLLDCGEEDVTLVSAFCAEAELPCAVILRSTPQASPVARPHRER